MGSGRSRPADSLADSLSPNHDMLCNKVAIITGPTHGIGYETARVLAKHGAHVVLAARNTSAAEECKATLIEEIKAELPNAQPQFTILHLDLASLTSVRRAANEFLRSELPLHLLINNAGISTHLSEYECTTDGFELHVGTNHLGHFYFTRLLLPKLRATATVEYPARVVNVSAAMHNPYMNRSSVEEIEKTFVSAQDNYNPLQAYARSKLYNIYHAQTLAKTEAPNNVLSFSLHPGLIGTNLGHRLTGFKRIVLNVLNATVLSSTNSGALTTIHCALREGRNNTGKYFANAALAQPNGIALDDTLRAKLIEVSENLIYQFEEITANSSPKTAQ